MAVTRILIFQLTAGIFLGVQAVSALVIYVDPNPCSRACGATNSNWLIDVSRTVFTPVGYLLEGPFGVVVVLASLLWAALELYRSITKKPHVNLFLASLLLGVSIFVRMYAVTCFC